MKRHIAIWIVLAGLVLMPAAAQAGRLGRGHGHRGYGYGGGWGYGHGGYGYGHGYHGHHHHGHGGHYYGWYGAAAAAAVLGTAVIVDSLYNSRDCGGYWDVERVWIPAVTERVWCRSCYTEYTDLGPSCWKEVVVRPGYYEDRRVWMNSR